MKHPLSLICCLACALGLALPAAYAVDAPYYDELRARCGAMEDTSCCLKSVDAMQAQGAQEKWGEMCPDGSWPDGLECLGSFSWCKSTGRSGETPPAVGQQSGE
jgi:hypothetical protein